MKTIYVSKNELKDINLFKTMISILKKKNNITDEIKIEHINKLCVLKDSLIISPREGNTYVIDTSKDAKDITIFHSSIKAKYSDRSILLKEKSRYNFIGPDELNKYIVSINETRYLFFNLMKEVLGLKKTEELDPDTVMFEEKLKDALYVASLILDNDFFGVIERCPTFIATSAYLLVIKSMLYDDGNSDIDDMIIRLLTEKENINTLEKALNVLSYSNNKFEEDNIKSEIKDFLGVYYMSEGKGGEDCIIALSLFCMFLYLKVINKDNNVWEVKFNRNNKNSLSYKELFKIIFEKHLVKLFTIYKDINPSAISLNNLNNNKKKVKIITDKLSDNKHYEEIKKYIENKLDIASLNIKIEQVSIEKYYIKKFEEM